MAAGIHRERCILDSNEQVVLIQSTGDAFRAGMVVGTVIGCVGTVVGFLIAAALLG